MIANNQQQLLPELVAFATVGADGAGRPVSERMDAEVFPRFDEMKADQTRMRSTFGDLFKNFN